MRIEVLPDDVLLEIFEFYMIMKISYRCARAGRSEVEAWQSLVHVCRRWRNVVLGSPRRLNLRLYCTLKTPVRDALDVWPAFPLVIAALLGFSPSTDNIIVALGQRNRVREIELYLTGSRSEEVLAVMQVSFPELTNLQLYSYGEPLPVIPDSFLGGIAPRLQSLKLFNIPFPGLPKLLLTATRLVHLVLTNIPHSAYISPEAMVALLSVLSSLEALSLQFESPQSLPDREIRSLLTPKRSILPALATFYFNGVNGYLEELVARIETPQLGELDITFNNSNHRWSRLVQFINCTPTLRVLNEAHIIFCNRTSSVRLRSRTSNSDSISCREPDRWSSSSHPFSMVEDFYIEHRYPQLFLNDDAIENTVWLQILLAFAMLKNLYLSKEFAPGIATALQELVGSRITEGLLCLQNIFVERLDELSGSFQENIGQFVAARQLSGHPIAIYVWDKRLHFVM